MLLLPLVLLLVFASGAPAAPAAAAPAASGSGWSWPLAGAPHIVEPFDRPEQDWLPGHRGVDLQAATGQPVFAPFAGQVSFAGTVVDRPVLVIEHAGGLKTSLEPVTASVAAGDWVQAGEAVGEIASGAHCSARCLHWGVRRDGQYLDPALLVSDLRPSVLLPLDGPPHRQAPAGPARQWVFPVAQVSRIQYNYGESRGRYPHAGEDFSAPRNTAIHAAAAGEVVRASCHDLVTGRSPCQIQIDHGLAGSARVHTLYVHMYPEGVLVHAGQRVEAGQLIGKVGSNGNSTGPHLHFEVWLNGQPSNPVAFLRARGTPIP